MARWLYSFRPISLGDDDAESGPRHSLIILTGLLLAAAALRLYRLDEGLWWDEILTYVKYVKPPLWETLTLYESENQHFLYILLAHLSIRIFGDSVWALRLPAVLFGVGSIAALYLFGREVGSRREALLSAALLTVSYHHVWFSQNARGYIGLLFWALMASWLFLRGLRELRVRWWLLYAVAAALGVFTHLMMLFVIAGHCIIHLAQLRARKRAGLPTRPAHASLGFFLAGILTLLLYGPVLPQVLGYTLTIRASVATWQNPLWTLLELSRGVETGFVGSIGAVVVLLVLGIGLWSFARTRPIVILLLVIPALLCGAVVVGLKHHLWPRFFIFAAGFGVLAVVRGAMESGELAVRLLGLKWTRPDRIGAALCAGLILASALSLPSVYGPKQDYEGALAFVEANKKPGDVVVTAGLAFLPYQELYNVGWESVETLESLNSIRHQAKRTWMVYTLPPHLQSNFPTIMQSIRSDFKLVKQFQGTLGGGTIYVCRSDKPLTVLSAKTEEPFRRLH